MNSAKTNAEILKKQKAAMSQGRAAHKAGRSMETNPYRFGTHLRDCWDNGFVESMSEVQ